jgi:hypothetical protein
MTLLRTTFIAFLNHNCIKKPMNTALRADCAARDLDGLMFFNGRIALNLNGVAFFSQHRMNYYRREARSR